MMLGTFQFKPPLVGTLVTLLLCSLLISLGVWQLHRAQTKQQMLLQLSREHSLKPTAISALSKLKTSWQYLPLQVSGYYDNRQQFLIDNKFYQHELGYHVITPMKIPGENRLLLVNRGWVPAATTRNILPELQSISGLQTIHGIIQIPLDKPFLLGQQEQQQGIWPYRIQGIDLQLMAVTLKSPVYPFILLLDPNAQYGFVRKWEFVTITPQKHIAYAVQWFVLAMTLFIIYIGTNLQRIKRK